MKLQKLKLAQIKPYWRNPRNNITAVEAVKRSIEEYGYNSPILVDENFVVIAGHTRLLALRDLGWKEAEVGVLSLSDEKAKAYRIADNKSAELATWDQEKLLQELREITKIETLDVFFPGVDLSEMISEDIGASSFSYPSEEKIQAAANNVETHFEEANAGYREGLYEVICPHCSESHFINKSEVLGMKPDV